MKSILIICCCSFLFLMISCSGKPEVNLSDPITSGRGFIESSLKGDFVKAEEYLLPDSTNKQYLDVLIEFNKKRDKIERENYRDASIIIDSITNRSDSVSIMYYYNSYKKEPSKLKLVRKGKDWLVDFKYSFDEDVNPSL